MLGTLLALALAAAPVQFDVHVEVDRRPLAISHVEKIPARWSGYQFSELRAEIGKDYSIHLKNPWGRRVAVRLSVDGVNTIDAEETGGKRWVLGPYEEAVIPGWQVSGDTARRFAFSNAGDSYVSKLGRSLKDIGTIEALVYLEEKPVPIITADTFRLGSHAAPVSGSVTLTSIGATSSAVSSIPTSASTNVSAIGTAMGDSTRNEVHEVFFEFEPEPVARIAIHYTGQEPGWCPER